MTEIAIVAHVSRLARAERLAELVDATWIVEDDGSLGAGRNHERAWEILAESSGKFGLVLEDDAVPVAGFRDQLEMVLRAAPSPLVSAYMGRSRPPHWQPSIARTVGYDTCFYQAEELLHHVAVAMRTDLIAPMLARIRTIRAYRWAKTLPIDEAIGRWARESSILISYANPSIIDHNHDLPSVIVDHVSQHTANEPGHRDNPLEVRKAWRTGIRASWDSSSTLIPAPVL